MGRSRPSASTVTDPVPDPEPESESESEPEPESSSSPMATTRPAPVSATTSEPSVPTAMPMGRFSPRARSRTAPLTVSYVCTMPNCEV